MSFYESDPISDAPFLELPSFQYGAWGMPGTFRRNNYSLLEPARSFLWQNYAPVNWVIPRSAVLKQNTPAGVSALGQIEDRFQLPPKSWLLAWAGYSSNAAGFRFSIYDEGAQDYAISERWQNGSDTAVDTSSDSGSPHMLPEPYLVVSPGALQAKVVNLANAINDFQMVVYFAVPKGQGYGQGNISR